VTPPELRIDLGRPRRIHVVARLAMTDGFRPIKRSFERFEPTAAADIILVWDPSAQCYRSTTALTTRSA